MEFTSLENVSLESINTAFNAAFSDYIVPMQHTPEKLQEWMTATSYDPTLSAGAFINGELVAIILHGLDTVNGEKILYNAGTGVIPARRGQGLTAQLYAFLLPRLRSEGVKKCRLEVITENAPAIRSYEKTGFRKCRELDCYAGAVTRPQQVTSAGIRPLRPEMLPALQTHWDIQPSWQNGLTAAKNSAKKTRLVGLFEGDVLCGYAIFQPAANRLMQLCITRGQRRKGYGRLLLQYIAGEMEKAPAIINVDSADEGTRAFLHAMGMKIFLRQYEMEWELS